MERFRRDAHRRPTAQLGSDAQQRLERRQRIAQAVESEGGFRFERSRACMIFYCSLLYLVVHISVIVLELGPYSPPPEAKPWISEQDWAMTKTNPSFKMFLHPSGEDRYISLSIRREGIWEPQLHERIMTLMGDFSNASFLDVGANIGFHTLAVASIHERVIAVEPIPSNANLLWRSVEEGGLQDRVQLLRVAATDGFRGEGLECMHVSSINRGHAFIRPSSAPNPLDTMPHELVLQLLWRGAVWLLRGLRVIPPARVSGWDGAASGEVVDYHHEAHGGGRCEFVQGEALQSKLQSRSDVLVGKIDVEGYEDKVLRGMREWLARSGPCYLFVEVFPSLQSMHDTSPVDMLAQLSELGYVLRASVNAQTQPNASHSAPIDPALLVAGAYGGRDTKYKDDWGGLPGPRSGDMVTAELHKQDLSACLSRFTRRPPGSEWRLGPKLAGPARNGGKWNKKGPESQPAPSQSQSQQPSGAGVPVPEIPLDTDTPATGTAEPGIGGGR